MSPRRFDFARRVVCGLCVAACFSLVGCGEPKESVPELVSVSGKVTYQGQPLPNAMVTFIPAEPEEATEIGRIVRPAGRTDAEGAFELAWGDNAGAPPGKYKVIVIALKPSEDDEVKPESLIPETYGNPKTSGLNGTVKETGENVLNFALQQ